jgi:hypothetical protein
MQNALKFEEIVSMRGRNLAFANIRGFGLQFADAVLAVASLEGEQTAILGGDVYAISEDGRVRPAYLNWFCNRQKGESINSYIERSHKAASKFLLDNKLLLDESRVIVLVTADQAVV